MAERIRVAVVGLVDGPEADAGAGVLACLDPVRYERIGILGDQNESGAARPGVCESVWILPAVEEPGFTAALALAIEREGLDAVLPGSARAAAMLAEGRVALSRAGARPGALNHQAVLAFDRDRLVETARLAGIPAARREEVSSEDLYNALEAREAWPLLVIGEHGARRRASDFWEAVRAHQALTQAGGSATLCELDKQVFEAALVLDEHAGPVAGAAVRVLADDERGRPWLAVTIENRPLLEEALCFARAAELAGPCQFLFHRSANTFELLDVRAGFPLWIEVVLAGGPNLVELAVELARGAVPANSDGFPCTPAGVLFSQTAEDHVVEPRAT